MVRYIRQMRAFAKRPTDTGPEGGGAIRDAGMADNLTALARELCPRSQDSDLGAQLPHPPRERVDRLAAAHHGQFHRRALPARAMHDWAVP